MAGRLIRQCGLEDLEVYFPNFNLKFKYASSIMKKIISIFSAVLCLVLCQSGFAILNLPPAPESPPIKEVISDVELKRLALALAYVKQYYIKKVDDKKLVNDAIGGLLAKLDPHSDYLDESDLKDLELVTGGEFAGVGIEVVPEDIGLRVVSPLDDSPAAKAGVKSGDLIVQINNQIVKDVTVREAINMMRGRKGSILTLTIVNKASPKPKLVKIKRDYIKVHTVKEKLLQPGYGYVRIAFFQDRTEPDLAKAIDKLKKENNGDLKGLILDLRNNPGGLLESGIQVADDFLDADALKNNKLIVYTEGQFEGSHIVAHTTPGELLSNAPMVVLINEGSASAAEIVAGALHDHKRAVLVGTRTFGKGSVQTILPIDEHSAIKLTTALYHTPSGRSIQAKGISPDIVVHEMQIEKDGGGANIRIGEANLATHIKSGESEGEAAEDADDTEEQAATEVAAEDKDQPLARSDYQLYESLNILKGLGTWRKKIM